MKKRRFFRCGFHKTTIFLDRFFTGFFLDLGAFQGCGFVFVFLFFHFYLLFYSVLQSIR